MMFPLARPAGVGTAHQAAPALTSAASTATAAAWEGRRALSFAVMFAIVVAAFEGPLRYALHLLHLDALIFARDAAIVGAIALFVVSRAVVNTVPASVGVFALLAGIHGIVSYANIGSVIPAAYGLKMFLPALCGVLAAAAIYRPGTAWSRLLALVWLAAAIGAAADRFWVDYPWVGMNVELGGLNVYLGRDWQSEVERVGGFSRSSINLAVLMPLLSFMLLTRLRNRLLIAIVCAVTLAVLVWTTQKGAIFAYGVAVLAWTVSGRASSAPLKIAVLVAALLMVFAPTVLIHFDMPADRGIFSFQSLIERIRQMWPDAWTYIGKFPPFLGVGLGGIGGAQRFFAPADFNAADNLFVYLFANFGIASLLYLGAVVLLGLTARVRDFRHDGIALASLVYLLCYGLVISLVEDQVASLWLGATVGWLVALRPERGVPAVAGLARGAR